MEEIQNYQKNGVTLQLLKEKDKNFYIINIIYKGNLLDKVSCKSKKGAVRMWVDLQKNYFNSVLSTEL